MRIAAAALCLLLTMSLAACSAMPNISSGTTSQEYPVQVGDMTIAEKPKQVAVLSGNLADVVLAIGYETSLVLGSEDCTQSELQVHEKINAADTAAMISKEVDLVLAETMADDAKAALEEAGVQVLLLAPAKNRETFEKLYASVGTALNGSTTGNNAGIKAAQKIFSSLDDLARLAPESVTVVTACYISDLAEGRAVTGDMLGSVVLSYMGMTNAFKGREGGTFSFADLKLSDPTMIFCPENVKNEIMQNADYKVLTAVKTGRVYAIDPHYMEWQGKTLKKGALEMMGLAYPELTESSTPSVSMPIATATPEPTAAPEETKYSPLALGDEGDEVLAMQQRLAELGFLTVEYGGTYGEMTVEAVKQFQLENDLEATGDADEETLRKLFADAQAPEASETPEASATETPSAAG